MSEKVSVHGLEAQVRELEARVEAIEHWQALQVGATLVLSLGLAATAILALLLAFR